jgi:hypothetical protein
MATKNRKKKEPGLVKRYNFHFLRGGRRQHWWTIDKGKAEMVRRNCQRRDVEFGVTVTEHVGKSISGRMIFLASAE